MKTISPTLDFYPNDYAIYNAQYPKKQEFINTISSELWSSPKNLKKITEIMPGLEKADIDKTNKLMKSIPPDQKNYISRIAVLFSSLSYRDFYNEVNNLEKIGFDEAELTRIKNIQRIIQKPLHNEIPFITKKLSREDAIAATTLNASYCDIFLNKKVLENELILKSYLQKLDFTSFLIDCGFPSGEVENNIGNIFTIHQGWNIESLPAEGIKIHIAAKNPLDYQDLLEDVLQDLIDCRATFKIVNPGENFKHFFDNENIQNGKHITIYQTIWDAEKFFSKHSDLLNEQEKTIVKGDKCFGGCVYGRYGSFVSFDVKNPFTGDIQRDDRTIPFPDYIKDISLADYIKCCKGKDGIEYNDLYKEMQPITNEFYSYEDENWEI